MSRVITFSRVFPSYHPRKGEDTQFVQKILSGEKVHTIRAGHRWKVGDWFSPRVWSGKPYRSKQIQFASDIEIKKIWDFSFLSTGIYRIGTRQYDGEVESHHELLELIAQNDGLSKYEFLQWFRYPRYFDGQIISWNQNVNY